MSVVRCPACGFNVSDEDGTCFICGSKLNMAESTISDAGDVALEVQNEQMPEDIRSVFGELSHEVVQAVFDEEDDI